jgi:acetolactate synthase I/II/III large subunit
MALGSDFILDALVQEGLTHLFLVPGGLIDPFLPALARHPRLRPIVAAHEGGAAYMADGYARASGRFGAVLGIGGPGLCNMATAVAAAKTDAPRRFSCSAAKFQSTWKDLANFRMQARRHSTIPR